MLWAMRGAPGLAPKRGAREVSALYLSLSTDRLFTLGFPWEHNTVDTSHHDVCVRPFIASKQNSKENLASVCEHIMWSR